MIERYLGHKVEDKDEMVAHVIRLAQASSANLCIIPMQDYLGLDNRARINEPSTLGKNWRWRLLPNQLTPQAGLLMKKLTKTYGRLPIVRTEERCSLQTKQRMNHQAGQLKKMWRNHQAGQLKKCE